MAMVVLVLVVALILAGYAIMSMSLSKRAFVQCVEAGPSSTVTARELRRRSFYVPNRTILERKGQPLDSDKYIRVVVKGDCLKPRNIVDGDRLIVQRIDDEVMQSIHEGSIILIYLSDTSVYKIREVKSVECDGFNTQYYLENGSVQESSKPHNRECVVGLVKFQL